VCSIFAFVLELLFVAKVVISIEEDLAKCGYELDTKFKSLIIHLYFWVHIENKI